MTTGAALDSSRIEIIINKLLQDFDATYVADDLLKKWDRGELSEKDQDIAAHFLINTGFLKTLQAQYSKQLTHDRYIAWIPFIEMISRTTETLPDDIVDPILVGMTENNKLEDIVYVQQSKKLHSRFKKLIKTFSNEKKVQLEEEKKQLTEKLQRHINDRMDAEIKKVSELLKEKFPDDSDILNITSDLDLARIRTLIQKKERDLQSTFSTTKNIAKKDPANSAAKNQISEDVLRNAKENPESAYDLAILLTQMEVYDDALTCLSYAPSSLEKDWLKLDLLIKSENFIDAISESFEIEKKYPENPETIFATLEFRAQALYGLGEEEKAIQILEKVLEISPKNHTAKVLLHSWRNT